MALIKCPECGQQVSDKAATCPNCGVKIADNIVRCNYCNEVYLKGETVCPHCKRGASTQQSENDSNTNNSQEQKPNDKKVNNYKYIFISLIIACAICGGAYYMYNDARSNKEYEEYQYAIQSQDLQVLQSYLDTYKDAPQAHRDSIASRIQNIKDGDREWTDAVVSNSKSMIEAYLKKNPDSPHKQRALHIIDSLDWVQCLNRNTEEAYKEYLDNHYDGEHYEEASDALKSAKAKNVTPEERAMIGDVFHNFFVSINMRDELGLTATVADNLTLLDKTNASKEDVVAFMHKLYKDNVKNMIWRLDKNYTIGKREIGDTRYEYSVTFTAVQDVTTDNDKISNKYRINAKVDPEGYISEFTMTKVFD